MENRVECPNISLNIPFHLSEVGLVVKDSLLVRCGKIPQLQFQWSFTEYVGITLLSPSTPVILQGTRIVKLQIY